MEHGKPINGGKDNITVVLVQNNKAQVQYDTAMPAANQKKSSDAMSQNCQRRHMKCPTSKYNAGEAPVSEFNKTPVIILTLWLPLWQYLQNPANQQVLYRNNACLTYLLH